MVRQGWFMNEADAVRVVLLEFIRRRHLDVMERFQRDDIEWAIKQKGSAH